MHALITLSHGSRHPRAKAGIQELTNAAAAQLGTAAADAHLEFDQPTLAGAARDLAQAGHTRAVVVPLLYTRAFHATVDVPEAVAAASEFLDLTLAEPLGTGADIARVLEMRVLIDAQPNSHIILYPVGTSDTEQTQAYEHLAEELERRCGHGVTGVSVIAATRGGVEALTDLAREHDTVHVLPLFTTHGTLLDKVYDALPSIEAETGAQVTASGPFTAALADVVAQRYRATLAQPTHFSQPVKESN